MKVLVVERDAAARRLLQQAAQQRGHEVEACADDASGWQLYQRLKPSLVLIAQVEAAGTEVDLCRRIRARAAESPAVVVMVTAAEQPELTALALDAGAHDCIVKPLGEDLQLRLAVAERRVTSWQERRHREERLVYAALHDPLTDLVHRSVLVERLERAARMAARRRGYLFAVVALSIDDFAAVRARLGGELADRLLVELSRRLEECVRSIDTLARLGIDEFAILLDELRDVSDPTRVATRIHQALSTPFRFEGREAFCTASIGIALSVAGYHEPGDLLANALEASKMARAQGPGHHQLFDPVLNARVMARVRLEARIREALEREEMTVLYQPIVAVASGRITGFEALAHWQDAEQGVIPPSLFIPVAEQSGLVHTLGWWVFRQACRQLGQWRQRFAAHHLTMSVNVASEQFGQPDVLAQVDEALELAAVDGAGVHLEITESTLMGSVESTMRTLGQLKERALELHVDDFGTGYSSLSYLCRFPIDALKIDRSFIGNMTHSPENLEVVRTIIQLAKNLGMTAVAEGVETEGQLAELRRLECEGAQGYLFGRPLSAAAASHLLEQQDGGD